MSHQQTSSGTGSAFTCLIVEDDKGFALLEARVVRDEGGNVTVCHTLADAGAAIAQRSFDLVLLDNHLPDGKAYDWFDRVSRRNPDAPIVMITGLPALAEAISLTRNGIFDYLTKPVDADVLAAVVQRARLRMKHRGTALPDDVAMGQSAAMRAVLTQLQQAARHTSATVLFTGESGSGKDVAARTLHKITFGEKAATTPFVAVNCAAVPAEMFEAELFGAERGAYTGADRRRTGLVAAAQGGTLFLDEIGEVPLALQAKLLRFIEGREFRALGGTENQPFTGRLIAATNRNLRAEVAAGRFREDLLYRIEVFTVALPPLRERREDIPALAECLLAQLVRRYERRPLNLRPEDLTSLQQHNFPGNARELRNILERSLLRTPDDSRWLALDRAGLGAPPLATPVTSSTPSAAPAVIENDVLPPERAGLTALEAQEYRLIRQTLREVNGGIRRAAAKLGFSPQALLRRLEKWPELRGDEK